MSGVDATQLRQLSARGTRPPHLNPIMTLSEMKLMIEPALTNQAMMA